MKTHCETHVQPDGTTVEVATIEHEGHTFMNLGAVVDPDRGTIVAYVSGAPDRALKHSLTTWDGTVLGPLARVSTWAQWTPYAHHKTTFHAWRFVAADGRVYSGRNAGPGMLVRLRTRTPRVQGGAS